MTGNGPKAGPDGARIYRGCRGQSVRVLVLGRLIVLLVIALFTVGIGWLVTGRTGGIVGGAIGFAFFLVLEMVTVFEVRILPDGNVEFRSFLRRSRVPAALIEEITGDLDEDEGIRSYSVRVGKRWRMLPLEEDADMAALLADLRRLNPALEVTGVWPAPVGVPDRS
jgi:hypothetical protein